MKERSVEQALETFRLYSEDGLSGVTCVVRPEGRYLVIPHTDGTSGRAPTVKEAHVRCHEVAKDYFRYRNVSYHIEKVEEGLERLKRTLERSR